ncbi:MAG: YgiQ family radical SAM protein [Bacteroidaceae bacterium]|nr:YgiQ family radical SAM protein [Bacteroidaceae bacterium]
MQSYKNISEWLPTTKKECEQLGWDELDVILFSGDAYVDHPSFGTAVIGRVLEAEGLRVAIVPQPNWQDDLRDFKKLGTPKLFFGVTAGCMDSMVNRYTAGKRLRSEDAYTPDGRHSGRPEYPTIVYTQILKKLFPDIPVVIGGIEASMRRLTHYDYWQDKLLPSILVESGADYLVYGMGEKPITAIAHALMENSPKDAHSAIINQPQIAFLTAESNIPNGISGKDKLLYSHSECLADRYKQAANFKVIEEESNKIEASRIIQKTGNNFTVVNPPYPPMTTEELDKVYDLPYTRLPHPKYKSKRIPAYEMIRHSITLHRGCFGGCAFCTISAHQGKQIASRSKASILKEAKQVVRMDDFKGYISDLGGPSANMYRLSGRDKELCRKCKRPTCLHPKVCPNLNTDLNPLIDIYQAVSAIQGVKKCCIGSGIRYDILQYRDADDKINQSHTAYTKELITKHVSGRLKVAPEHTSDSVLNLMRKPSFRSFEEFKRTFDKINKEQNLNQQLIPYFISSHPQCTPEDMAELAVKTKKLNFHLEQIQDFTPTPMTLSTEIFYTGINPYTMKPVYTARTQKEKLAQRQFFFWYEPAQRSKIIAELKRMGRSDLIHQLF